MFRIKKDKVQAFIDLCKKHKVELLGLQIPADGQILAMNDFRWDGDIPTDFVDGLTSIISDGDVARITYTIMSNGESIDFTASITSSGAIFSEKTDE